MEGFIKINDGIYVKNEETYEAIISELVNKINNSNL